MSQSLTDAKHLRGSPWYATPAVTDARHQRGSPCHATPLILFRLKFSPIMYCSAILCVAVLKKKKKIETSKNDNLTLHVIRKS